MGVATTRPMDRIAAAMGELEKADILFKSADDIPNGGVLCALPALLAIGLLRHAERHFTFPSGYLRAGRKPFIDTIVVRLCEELNATETHDPGTNLRLKSIPLRSSPFLPGQDV